MHRQAFGQVEGAFAATHQVPQAALRPRRAQNDVGEAERLIDAYAALAERAALSQKQTAVRRVVQVDGVLVREHELNEAERVTLARRLPNGDLAVAPYHLVAALRGVKRIGRETRQELVLEDRGRYVPGWIHDRVFHHARENRRRRLGLAHDDAGLMDRRAVAQDAEPELWDVDRDVLASEIRRQPAPALHIGDQIALDP